MATDGLQSYISAVSGLTKMTRDMAATTARALLSQAGLGEVATDAQERVTRLTDEIITASRANAELWQKMVASEVDRAAGRLGFVRADELEGVRRELSELRLAMAYSASAAADPASATAESAPVTTASSVAGGAPAGPPDFLVPRADPPAADSTPTRRAAARRTTKTPARSGGTGTATPTGPAKRTAGKRAASKRTAGTTGPGTPRPRKAAGSESPTASTADPAAPQDSAARTAPARETAARTAPARTAPARKAPARKRATRPTAPPPESDPADAELTAPATGADAAPEPPAP